MDTRQRERIYQAKRAGLVARIADTVGETTAEALMATWEAEAAARALPREGTSFWTEVEPWMAVAASRSPGRRP